MFSRAAVASVFDLPRLNSSQLEMAKWVGLVAMLFDHANKVFFAGEMWGWSEFGRLAFPLFAFTLAQGVDELTLLHRVHIFRRVFFCALVSQVFFWALWGRVDFNVVLTLAMALLVSIAWDRSKGSGLVLAVAALVASVGVEFDWPGMMMALCMFGAVRTKGPGGVVLFVLGLSFVNLPNGNAWAYWALPVLLLMGNLGVQVPRVRGLFYWLYPAHMALFCLLAG